MKRPLGIPLIFILSVLKEVGPGRRDDNLTAHESLPREHQSSQVLTSPYLRWGLLTLTALRVTWRAYLTQIAASSPPL